MSVWATGVHLVLVVSAGGHPGRHSVQPALAASAETPNTDRNRALGRRRERPVLIDRARRR